jgi:hypothetical protein
VESKEAESHGVKYPHGMTLVISSLAASVALADDFKTVNGKEYKNVTVSRVEADGIVIKGKSGISKVYFVELPKDVQERFRAAARHAKALDIFNRITEEYPASPQAKTVRQLRSFLRDKEATQDGPFTAVEAQRLRSVMDAVVSIKRNHRTATPKDRAASGRIQLGGSSVCVIFFCEENDHQIDPDGNPDRLRIRHRFR